MREVLRGGQLAEHGLILSPVVVVADRDEAGVVIVVGHIGAGGYEVALAFVRDAGVVDFGVVAEDLGDGGSVVGAVVTLVRLEDGLPYVLGQDGDGAQHGGDLEHIVGLFDDGEADGQVVDLLDSRALTYPADNTVARFAILTGVDDTNAYFLFPYMLDHVSVDLRRRDAGGQLRHDKRHLVSLDERTERDAAFRGDLGRRTSVVPDA